MSRELSHLRAAIRRRKLSMRYLELGLKVMREKLQCQQKELARQVVRARRAA
jgi:hypothetical protein